MTQPLDWRVSVVDSGGRPSPEFQRKWTDVSTLTSSKITVALGYTPYNSTNPSNYISSINSSMVTTALGYVPVNKTGDTMSGSLSATKYISTIPAGTGVNLDVSTSTPISLVASSSALLMSGGGYALVAVAEISATGANSFWILGNGTSTLVTATSGNWVASTGTPGANQFSVHFDGTNYRIYTGSGFGSLKFAPIIIKMH